MPLCVFLFPFTGGRKDAVQPTIPQKGVSAKEGNCFIHPPSIYDSNSPNGVGDMGFKKLTPDSRSPPGFRSVGAKKKSKSWNLFSNQILPERVGGPPRSPTRSFLGGWVGWNMNSENSSAYSPCGAGGRNASFPPYFFH